MQSRMAQLAFGPLRFDLEMLSAGDGPPLLFLHAIDGVEGARELLARLSRRFTVHAPSHPGFGASSRPPEVTGISDLAFFYLDLLSHLDLRDVTLVGASFGGWIASEIMTRDCSRISRSVLAGPLGLLRTANRANVLRDVFSLPAVEWPAAFCANPGRYLAPRRDMDAAQLLRIARNQEAAALYGWSPYMANARIAQRLHRISKPTLLISGEADCIAPADYFAAYAAAIPGARLHTVAGSGHLLHADAPEAFAEEVFAFCRERSI